LLRACVDKSVPVAAESKLAMASRLFTTMANASARGIWIWAMSVADNVYGQGSPQVCAAHGPRELPPICNQIVAG
jgi:hypothetical protein